MQQSIVKFYYFVVQTLLNMFQALLCPSLGARQTAVAACGFRMNVEVDVLSAVVGLLINPEILNYLLTKGNLGGRGLIYYFFLKGTSNVINVERNLHFHSV
jgi:hypothetical protein